MAAKAQHTSQPLGISQLLPSHNLPGQLSSFIGRESELAALKQLLLSTRLLTLTGSGGAGKTRLALQLALNNIESYKDGAWLVELAPLNNPALIIPALHNIFGLQQYEGSDPFSSLQIFLHDRQLLLILDNCEHLIGDCAAIAESLLRACPSLQILVTSREALRIDGETVWRVPSLSIPPAESLSNPVELEQFEAARLFSERARSALPGFEINRRNIEAVVQICRRLDGIPLALELAAARIRLLTVEDIAANLDERFRLLSFGNRTLLPRQQTLKALIDWSYYLLSFPERTLLNRLSAFKGGWTLAGAEAVAGLDPGATGPGSGKGIVDIADRRSWRPDDHLLLTNTSIQIIDLMQQLCEKSLVSHEESTAVKGNGGSERRYRLLETIRYYAEEKLLAAGESYQVNARHLDYFVSLAEKALPYLRGPEQVNWLNRLEREQDNFRAALDFARQQGPAGVENLMRLTAALWPFWLTRGYLLEANQRLEQALEISANYTVAVDLQARVLNGAGVLAHTVKNYSKALTFQQQSLDLYRATGDRRGIATATNDLGWLAIYQFQAERAQALAQTSLELARELKDPHRIASSLMLAGVVARVQGAVALARQYFEESLQLWRELGDTGSIAAPLGSLARLAFEEGDYEKARPLGEEAFFLRYQEGNKLGLFTSIFGLVIIAIRQGELLTAARLLGVGETMLKAAGSPAPDLIGVSLEELKAMCQPLGADTLERAIEEGRRMPLTRVMLEARSISRELIPATPSLLPQAEGLTSSSHQAPGLDGLAATEGSTIMALTNREKDILRLVAQGLTNAEIAEQLKISPRTVHAHLRTIFSKLSVTTRSAATRFALDHQLI